jgi:alkylhydroperoxidase family enzyme
MIRPLMLEKAVAALLEAPGHTASSMRHSVFERLRRDAGSVPEEMEALVEKIAACPWSVADADIARLRDAGYSEDQIYELLLAAATGAGMRRFDAGLRAMEEAG